MKGKSKKLDRLIEIHELLEINKGLYKEYDALLQELIDDEGVFEIRHKKTLLRVKDNFESSNTVFKASFFRRYNLEVIRNAFNPEVFRIKKRRL